MKNEINYVPHETIIERLKEAIADIEDVKRFSIILKDEPTIIKGIGYTELDKISSVVTEEYYQPQYYVINVISKDNIKYRTQVTTFGLELHVYRKSLSKICKYITDDIQKKFENERKIIKENAINKALLNAYEDRDKIIDQETRKENKKMNNEESRTLKGKSDDYIIGISCAAQAFSEVDKGRFRNSDAYNVILNSYYKGFEICKAYLKGASNDENKETINKIIKDMDELADFFDGFLNSYADATLYYYKQGKKESEEA